MPGPWRTLEDLRIVLEQIHFFRARIALFRSFPPERLFAVSYPVDPLGDMARVAISRLLVRVAVEGDGGLRFDLGAEEGRALPRASRRSGHPAPP
ncbi:MAG: hypothetical protein KatS3mg115_2226 [Candidatus Poribacteria bacterium]|nr:MAG: hypothetical protein KatS3mg115_2226 [Candidatus Poribacteria bacterium]